MGVIIADLMLCVLLSFFWLALCGTCFLVTYFVMVLYETLRDVRRSRKNG